MSETAPDHTILAFPRARLAIAGPPRSGKTHIANALLQLDAEVTEAPATNTPDITVYVAPGPDTYVSRLQHHLRQIAREPNHTQSISHFAKRLRRSRGVMERRLQSAETIWVPNEADAKAIGLVYTLGHSATSQAEAIALTRDKPALSEARVLGRLYAGTAAQTLCRWDELLRTNGY